jgi:protein TonB
VFPIIASRAHVSGTVDIEAMVDRQGRVSTATVVRGNPLLTEAARRAVLAWRYEPASVDGEPAEAKVLVKVNFQDVRK